MNQPSWRQGWEISEQKREWFRKNSLKSASRKKHLAEVNLTSTISKRIYRLKPELLMPQQQKCGINSISLFSGCGGLDIGFERAGFEHNYAIDILDICGETLRNNRPEWHISSGTEEGDVQKIKWKKEINISKSPFVIHGGPPCQPFSNSGRQLGEDDSRNMIPQFFRAVRELKPDAFIMENVAALGSKKFLPYLNSILEKNISKKYIYAKFYMYAPHFGVPQQRNRLFVVGFKKVSTFKRFIKPLPTHSIAKFLEIHKGLKKYIKEVIDIPGYSLLPETMGVREALGMDKSSIDGLAPTFRSGFTGPRNSTSILNGASSQKVLQKMGLWGNGIAPSMDAAYGFPPENGTERLCTSDIALIQGFPTYWKIYGPVYKVLGQLGNSVAPPVAYQIAMSVRNALVK